MDSNITAKEEENLLQQLRERYNNGNKKFSNILYKLVIQKVNFGMSYSQISDWLKEQNINMSESKIQQNIYYFKKKVLQKVSNKFPEEYETPYQKTEINQRNKEPPMQEIDTQHFDFEKRKRELIQEARNKNTGLDKIRKI